MATKQIDIQAGGDSRMPRSFPQIWRLQDHFDRSTKIMNPTEEIATSSEQRAAVVPPPRNSPFVRPELDVSKSAPIHKVRTLLRLRKPLRVSATLNDVHRPNWLKATACSTVRSSATGGIVEGSRRRRRRALETFTLIATDANELAAEIHFRMPVIVHPEDRQAWLAGEEFPLVPFPTTGMTTRRVSTFADNSRNEGAQFLGSRLCILSVK